VPLCLCATSSSYQSRAWLRAASAAPDTVFAIDGHAVRSCITPVSAVAGTKIPRLAVSRQTEKPHTIRRLDRGAGLAVRPLPAFNGWIMTSDE